jgi:hypothetical protein
MTAAPAPRSAQSTAGTLITVTPDGRRVTTPVMIVHARGTVPSAEVVHHCGTTCGRPA